MLLPCLRVIQGVDEPKVDSKNVEMLISWASDFVQVSLLKA